MRIKITLCALGLMIQMQLIKAAETSRHSISQSFCTDEGSCDIKLHIIQTPSAVTYSKELVIPSKHIKEHAMIRSREKQTATYNKATGQTLIISGGASVLHPLLGQAPDCSIECYPKDNPPPQLRMLHNLYTKTERTQRKATQEAFNALQKEQPPKIIEVEAGGKTFLSFTDRGVTTHVSRDTCIQERDAEDRDCTIFWQVKNHTPLRKLTKERFREQNHKNL